MFGILADDLNYWETLIGCLVVVCVVGFVFIALYLVYRDVRYNHANETGPFVLWAIVATIAFLIFHFATPMSFNNALGWSFFMPFLLMGLLGLWFALYELGAYVLGGKVTARQWTVVGSVVAGFAVFAGVVYILWRVG